MAELELKLCSDEELVGFYSRILERACNEKGMTLEEYLLDYLFSNHRRAFLRHLEDMWVGPTCLDCGNDYGADDGYDDDLADEADRLLDEYEVLQMKS